MANDKSFPVFSLAYNIFAIPYNFLIGFIVGLAAPVAAIAAIVAGVRLLTGKVPFLSQVVSEEGERQLNIRLVAPEQVEALFAEQKEKVGGDLVKMQAEIKAIIEETRADAGASAQEEIPVEA